MWRVAHGGKKCLLNTEIKCIVTQQVHDSGTLRKWREKTYIFRGQYDVKYVQQIYIVLPKPVLLPECVWYSGKGPCL